MNQTGRESAKSRYEKLKTERDPYLRRGRDAAELTIPALLPPEGSTGATELPTPFQGLGARGANNLASKLMLALMPPNQPFFKMAIDDITLQELTGQDDLRAEVEEALNSYERSVLTEIETANFRPTSFEAFRHLVVTGNYLLHIPKEGGLKGYRLDRYVVQRDHVGNVLEVITQEPLTYSSLPDNVREAVEQDSRSQQREKDEKVELYTWITRQGTKFQVHQEVNDIRIEGTDGEYPLEKSPFIPLRWTKIEGEHYGRGHVEEYIGDLRSLEALTKAIVEGSAAAAKILFLVNPNSNTSERDVANANNLDVITGLAEDVTVIQVNKASDFSVALQTVDRIEKRLSQAFMLMSAIQRDAERVTAEEIRLLASELEDSLGGVYSVLSQELQLPLVRRVIAVMERGKKLPKLPSNVVKPTIVAGMEALGRSHDLNRLMNFARTIQEVTGPEAFLKYIDASDFITRIGTGFGLDMGGLVISKEEIAQREQREQEMQMNAELGPSAIDAQAKMAQKGQQQQ